MSIHEFPAAVAERSAKMEGGSAALESMAADLERLIRQANAAKELPLLAYLLQLALNEAQVRLEG
jgi:hypothetical protein